MCYSIPDIGEDIRLLTEAIERMTNYDASAPCKVPESVSLENMWKIRISKSKGGIHGIFVDNVFYVIWFDPHHNLYPDKNHGGLRKVTPPSTCCKDRDKELKQLRIELADVKEQVKFWETEAISLEAKLLDKQDQLPPSC